jgi:hypothetical protein
MTPGSFDAETSREMVGDERARKLEEKARTDADDKRYDPPLGIVGSTYWSNCMTEFARVTYITQWRKRTERNQRKAANLASKDEKEAKHG